MQTPARQTQLADLNAGNRRFYAQPVRLPYRITPPQTVTHQAGHAGSRHPLTAAARIDLGSLSIIDLDHFANQLQKDSHITEGSHQLAWICHEHGIEQPMKETVR